MLYPQFNNYRQMYDLSGFWDFRVDKNDEGIESNWKDGLVNAIPIAVPASWNDQFADNRDFLGPAWYQTKFNLPWNWSDKKLYIRFGSINYIADIWLNGKKIGHHEGGHLAFEYDITSLIKDIDNLLTIRVDGRLSKEHVPPGNLRLIYPPTNYDFFPFCGIHRPVILYALPHRAIKDLNIFTSIDNQYGFIEVEVILFDILEATGDISIDQDAIQISEDFAIKNGKGKVKIKIDQAQFWGPNDPHLYELTIRIKKENQVYDSYTIPVGIRTIEVKGDQLLLNGKPIFLTGFGRHEDFPIVGRGYTPAVIIKDFSLMRWIGANSFRTSHYPYSEQMMDLADKLGFLIIDEIPAVGLTFDKNYVDKHFELCKQYVKELIARDKNHPSVIAWSLANEPHSSIKSKEFFKELYDLTKEVDPSRLVTVVNMMGVKERAFEFCDILCLNRYYGWYTEPGQIEEGVRLLSQELDEIYKLYKKPIILTEFGADTFSGWHSQPPEMFSEEYQAEFLKRYIDKSKEKPFLVGQHVWNLCDFKTSQGVTRMNGMNYKGVFTRDRRPKMAAHVLKDLWKKD
jgi:beta-glucuronidase